MSASNQQLLARMLATLQDQHQQLLRLNERLQTLEAGTDNDRTNAVDRAFIEECVRTRVDSTFLLKRDTLRGTKGDAGKDGKDGKDGIDGVNGLNGKDGKDGIDGKNGKDGARGKDGKTGAKGKDGKAGKDGASFDVSKLTADDVAALKAKLGL